MTMTSRRGLPATVLLQHGGEGKAGERESN